MTESWASSPAVRSVMRGNRSRDTRPELRVRSLLHAAGLRYRVNLRPLAGHRSTVDIAFTRIKVAVFIDGCFWHGCAEHLRPARTNAAFWAGKIAGNRARDARTDKSLSEAGWVSLRFWEHEEPMDVASRVIDAVRKRRIEQS